MGLTSDFVLRAVAAAPPRPAPARALAAGTVLGGRFEIERLARRGGMGDVYRARDLEGGGAAAIKVMQRPYDGAARFEQEARALASLSHEHVVRYLAHGEAPVFFLAMEWLDGEDLCRRLAGAGLSGAETLQLARGAAAGLAAAHARGLLHRDVKPSNLFLVDGDPGRVKLIDFGIARPLADAPALTRAGAALGTAGYMAPEQAEGARDVDARVDVYALGCVLRECDPPPGLAELLARMTAPERAARPADGAAVLEELARVGEDGGGARAARPAVSVIVCDRRVPVDGFDAEVAERAGGGQLVTMRGHGSAIAQAAAAARCALALRAKDPDAQLALAAGARDEAEAAARAAQLEPAADGVVVDRATARLLDEEFVVEDAPPRRVELAVVERARFRFEGEIARGGMGRILAAEDLRLRRPVAIKELFQSGLMLLARFEREVAIAARLQHPGILGVYEAGRWPSGEPFFVMRRVRGRSLQEAIDAAHTPEQRMALLPHAVAAAEALAYAHSQRVVHRDLKPGNILVGDFGETVLIDWGLAKDLAAPRERAGAPTPPPAADAEQISVLGVAIGTPAFMAPEQAAGGDADERTDVYAMGAILYRLLAGRLPHGGRSAEELMENIRHQVPPPLGALAPGTPTDLQTLVAKAMAREPAQRYPSGVELAEDLARFQTGRLVSAHRYTWPQLARRFVRRHRAAVAVAGALLALLAALSVTGVRVIIDERDRARRGLATALAQKGLAAERERAWGRAALYYQAAIGQDDAQALRYAAGRAEARLIRPVARHEGHRAWVRAVAVGGGDVVSVDEAGKLRRWSLEDGRLIGTWEAAAPIFSVAATRDGGRVAVGADDGNVYVLDAALRLVSTEKRHGGRIWSLTFAPDGAALLSAGEDGAVRVGARAVGGHAQRVYAAVFSPDGARVASASDDRTVRVSGELVATAMAGVRAAAFSGDGKRLFFAGWDSAIRVADLGKADAVETWWDAASVHALALSPDGTFLASAGDDARVRLWDAATQALLAVLDGHAGQVSALAFDVDGKRLVSAGRDGVPRVWDVTAVPRIRGVGHRGTVGRLVFSADGARLVSSAADRTVRVWNVPSGEEAARANAPGMCAYGAFVAGGRFGAACDEGVVRLFAADGREERVIAAGRQLAYAAAGNGWVAAGQGGGWIHVWDPGSGRLIRERQGHEHAVYGMRALKDGTLLTSSLDNTVAWWSSALEPLGRWRARSEDGLLDAAMDPRGRFVVACGNGPWIYRWMLPGGEAAPPLVAHTDTVWQVEVSGDGEWVASGSSDGTARLWRTADWSSSVLRGPEGMVRALAFAPDGKTLATGHENGAVLLWDVRTRERVRRFGSGEIGDDGACGALERSSWHDGGERAVVERACREAVGVGRVRVEEAMRMRVVGEVDAVETWR